MLMTCRSPLKTKEQPWGHEAQRVWWHEASYNCNWTKTNLRLCYLAPWSAKVIFCMSKLVIPDVENLGVCFFPFDEQNNLSFKDFERVIHIFITFRLNYFTAIDSGTNKLTLSGCDCSTMMQPGDWGSAWYASSLHHWLPLRFRIDFQLLLHKARRADPLLCPRPSNLSFCLQAP